MKLTTNNPVFPDAPGRSTITTTFWGDWELGSLAMYNWVLVIVDLA